MVSPSQNYRPTLSPHIKMSTILCCPSCKKTFKTHSCLTRHTARAPSCKWVRHRHHHPGEVEMRDYRELSDQEDDHLGNQDLGTVGELGDLEKDEFAEVEESTYTSSLSTHAIPHEAPNDDSEDPILTIETYPGAGQILRYDSDTHATYTRTRPNLETEGNHYYPFLNEGDYEIARWAMEQGPGQNSLTDLLSINQVKAADTSSCICVMRVC